MCREYAENELQWQWFAVIILIFGESDVCCRLQVAPPGERYGGNRRPGRKQRQTTAE